MWVIVSLQVQINRLKNVQPSITVEPLEEHNICFLKVQNKGAVGSFKAQIELSSDSDPTVNRLSHYNGYWEYGSSNEVIIDKGHENR